MTPASFTRRIQAIVEQSERPPAPTLYTDAVNRRLCIQFQAMPDADTCALMKSNGFKYRGGSTAAWVRPITHNALQSSRLVMAQLTERTPEDNA